MSDFLEELETVTTGKEWNMFHGKRPTVIVIDEANALKQMANREVVCSCN